MGRAWGDMHKISSLRFVHFVPQLDLQEPFDDIERLGLAMVDVRGRASIKWHHPFHHEVGPIGLCSGCEKSIDIARPVKRRSRVCSYEKRQDTYA